MIDKPRSPEETQEVDTLAVIRALQAQEEEITTNRRNAIADVLSELKGSDVISLED